MARVTLVLLICQILSLPILSYGNEDNPLLDLASSFLQNMGEDGNDKLEGLSAIGNIVGTLMQGDNAKNLGSMLGQDGGNAGDVLSGLGSLLGGQDGKINPSLVGSMVSMFANQMASNGDQPKREKRETKENGMENILSMVSGLGGLLGGQDGKIDPSLVGTVASMFAQQLTSNDKENQREKRQANSKEAEPGDINMGSIINMASGLLGNKNVAGIMPMIMNTLSSFSDEESNKRADEHKDHASFLPPFLEKAHLYWDVFINSELGKTIWEKSGFKKATKSFIGPDGKLSFELMFKNFENHSFRRHWIKAVAQYLTDMVVHVAKPEVYQRYIVSAQYIMNSFLDSQGLPKTTHFNMNNPEKSITSLTNYVLKKYLDMDTDVSEYVKPAMDYIKQILKMAQSASQKFANRADYHAVADRLTDTLNLEVIEPVLRVYRAYKHSLQAPHCQEHLMCVVNKHHDQDKHGLPGFKAGLTKLSSMIASAALSFQHGNGFWDLYKAIQSDVNCDAKYPADCAAFHEHEMKVTTEVYHSEL
ncbi:uncharacterized protein LOC120634289 [Pararge aegeria]|uniref:uncharacterized protein LOC120634289 n=1 Tax=Pararge aegeria TaxID=116150 RepID=UPI0019D0C9FA|nr:uncharacterized protein LOC120634289 [Pararge aegeria]